MKKTVINHALCVLLLISFSMSCVNPPGILKPKIEGKYIRIKDNGREGDLNFLKSLITEVNFGEQICRFDYFGTTMSGKYTIDGNYVYIEVGYDMGTLAMEIINSDTLEGEGWIDGTFIKVKPKKGE